MNLLKQHALNIFQAGLNAVNSEYAVKKHIKIVDGILQVDEREYKLSEFNHIDVIGFGKASALMAKAVEDSLGKQIRQGYIVVKYGHVTNLSKIKLHEAGHPIPDEAGVKGAVKIIDILSQASQNDLILCLISGGGSALLPAPVNSVTLEEKQAVTRLLLSCGATIHEMNAVRKHISTLKGGQMARMAFPATLVSLILSDVIGDNPDVISSGPTAPDVSTFHECIMILKKYQLYNEIPETVLKHLKKGEKSEIPETPKLDDDCFKKVQNLIVGNNRMAAQAAAEKAETLGYQTKILTTELQGKAREAATYLVSQFHEEMQKSNKPFCLIAAGETTVNIQGNGKGGRNQELALAAANALQKMKDVCLLSAGTDGNDGPTDAAGAIVDHETVERAREMGIDPLLFLENNDSWHFFEKLGDHVKTGPTNTNVMDLQIMLSGTFRV